MDMDEDVNMERLSESCTVVFRNGGEATVYKFDRRDDRFTVWFGDVGSAVKINYWYDGGVYIKRQTSPQLNPFDIITIKPIGIDWRAVKQGEAFILTVNAINSGMIEGDVYLFHGFSHKGERRAVVSDQACDNFYVCPSYFLDRVPLYDDVKKEVK